MKTQKKSILKKVRAKISLEEFYTFSDWPSKEIDGVEFIAVNKRLPTGNDTQIIRWLTHCGSRNQTRLGSPRTVDW